MPSPELHPTRYFRMPWSLTDNVLGWLEPTKRCNLSCKGCYSRNDASSEKSLEQVRRDLEVFTSKRRVDSISIAGGDPLTHPGIADIVRMIRHDFGLKPIVNTNGIDLSPELLRELVQAGVAGFTFHIDSGQKRRGWWGKDELELCALREHYASMVADAGDIGCAFNMTVYRDTARFVPDLMDWGATNIERVHTMVFILFRTMRRAEFDYFAQGRPVPLDDVVYEDQDLNPEPLTTPEMIELVRERIPDFQPAAYLGGTEDPESFKWTIAARYGDGERIHGYAGPKFMELVQNGHHAATGRYLAYSPPSMLRHGRAMLPSFGLVDPGTRRAAGAWLRHGLRHPTALARPLHLQSVLFIQPIDHLADGRINMCDGCPDMTVHDGELVWSCRLDERVQHGCFLSAAPRAAEA
jgi:hypothetical protein